MKIALIIEHFDPARGGAENYTFWLAEQLTRRGHAVHVVCHDSARRRHKYQAAHQGASHDAQTSANAGKSPLVTAPDGVYVHRLPAIKLSTGIGFRQFGNAARNWCREQQPDVTHSMTVAYPGDLYHPHAGVYARMREQSIAARETGRAAALKRLLLRFSGKQRALLSLERRAAQAAAGEQPWKILCLSSAMIADFESFYGVAKQRMLLLENPIMTPPPDMDLIRRDRHWFREAYGLSATDRVAVFVGHDFRRKGLAWAIRAVAESQSSWKLVVAGLGKVKDYVDLAQRLGVAERVKFIGPTRATGAVYSAADVLLLPTFYDSFGLVALEALSYGLPVISTRFLGCAAYIENHKLGIIVDSPRKFAAMAAALDMVELQFPDRMDMARRAVAAGQALSPAVHVDTLEALYARCRNAMLAKRG
ncbi:MAG: glycosyltransferase family 4 protein [Phycisphaerae bacterium]